MAIKAATFAVLKAIFPGSDTGLGGFMFGKGFAEGGRPTPNTPSIVGERGPEVFVPDTSGTIIPNEQLGGLTINFNGNITDKRYVEDFIIPEINKAVRMGRA